jgi:Nucleotidyltransferase domain
VALIRKAYVYGFGSYFKAGNSRPADIDILIVHSDYSPESIQSALGCKRHVMSQLAKCHVTILSVVEEGELNFIDTCQAKLLCSIAENESETVLDHLVATIQAQRFTGENS